MYDTMRAVLKAITDLGYAVYVRDNEHGCEVVAIHTDSGERFGVTNADEYKAACELAELLGVELDDG